MNPFHDPVIATRLIRACLKNEAVVLPPPRINSRYSLGLVCSSWRNFIVSCTDFWVSYIFLPAVFYHPHEKLAIFHSFVARSVSNPLTFQFLSYIPGPDQGSFEILPRDLTVFGGKGVSIVNMIILPYVDRIRYLRCPLAGEEHDRFLFGISSGAFQLLEAFDIAFVDLARPSSSSSTFNQISDIHVFQSLPRLRKVGCSLFNGIGPLHLRLPLSQLTEMNFGTTPIKFPTFIKVVYLSTSSLVKAHFNVENDNHAAFFKYHRNPPVRLTALTTLKLRLINASFYPQFVQAFEFPVIEQLWIERIERTFPFKWDISSFTSLLYHSGGLLKEFRLSVFPYKVQEVMFPHHVVNRGRTTYSDLDIFFEVAPKLQSLHLPIGVNIPSRTLKRIGNGDLLPKLMMLELATNEDPGNIFEMIRQRNRLRPASSASSWYPIPQAIVSLSLTLPSTSPDSEEKVEKDIDSLCLSGGFTLRYIQLCDTCDSHCCFSSP